MATKVKAKIDSITTAELDTICAEDTLTITPNKRTCANLTDRAVAYKMKEKRACKVPEVYDLERWIRESFSSLRMANIAPFSRAAIISESAYAGYWVREFSFDETVCKSLNISDYLNPMIKADKIATRWKFGTEYICDTPLSGRFKLWRQRVHARLSSGGYVTINQALEMLIKAIKDGQLKIADNVALYSFDEVPPLYSDLFNVLASKSNVINIEVQHDKIANWKKVSTKNKSDQYETAARWALQYHTHNPHKRLAIVVPDMEANKKRLIRELDDLFKPQWTLDLQSYKLAYDVSLGDKLTSFSFINDALFTLSINTEKENVENIARIFRMPSIKHFNIERYTRHKFANTVMDNGAFEKPLSSAYMHQECPLQIKKRLSDFDDVMNSGLSVQLPSEWAKKFSNALDALGWLRDAGSSEHISNGIDGLKECFDKLANLDLHLGAIDMSLAHKLLCSYCEYHTVNASVGNTPISILGTLEAAGLEYDAFWVVDCNADVFPSMVSLNDCLPLYLQQEKGAPHSSVQREFEYTNRLFDRYKSSCSQLYTSYVVENEKCVEVKPAYILEFVEFVPSLDEIICTDVHSRKQLHFQSFDVVKEIDTRSVSVKTSIDGLKTIKGGSLLVQDAMNCKMGAYIKHELGYKEINCIKSIGYTPQNRGDIVHEALEHFWTEIKKISLQSSSATDHETLISLPEQDISALLEEGVESGIFWTARDDVPVMLRNSEKELVLRTLHMWIEKEKERTPFNVVGIEMNKVVPLGEFTVKIRIDRVDQINVANNDLAVALDYKTGENNIKQALASKFASQLPLASLPSLSTMRRAKGRPIYDGEISGVAYANVCLNNTSVSGIGRGSDLIDFGIADVTKHRSRSAPKDWDKLKEYWKGKMIQSVTDYASGKLTYTPSIEACAYCPIRNYCEHTA